MLVKDDSLSAYMAALGRQGGLKGGKRRLITMTDEQRRASARHAAVARFKTMTDDQRRQLARKAADARWQKKSAFADR